VIRTCIRPLAPILTLSKLRPIATHQAERGRPQPILEEPSFIGGSVPLDHVLDNRGRTWQSSEDYNLDMMLLWKGAFKEGIKSLSMQSPLARYYIQTLDIYFFCYALCYQEIIDRTSRKSRI
jgi:hypothetical protein